jgi:hypothetical protein
MLWELEASERHLIGNVNREISVESKTNHVPIQNNNNRGGCGRPLNRILRCEVIRQERSWNNSTFRAQPG